MNLTSGGALVWKDSWNGRNKMQRNASLSFFTSSNRLQVPKALATWAVMQAFMNINVTLKAEVLLAFWAGNTKARFISCDKTKWVLRAREERNLYHMDIGFHSLTIERKEKKRCTFLWFSLSLSLFSRLNKKRKK